MTRGREVVKASRVTPRRHDSEAGDTLIEVLLALIVLSIASLSLIIAFTMSISASAEHRTLASFDTALRTASEEAMSQMEQQTAAVWASTGCVGAGQVTFSLASGYSGAITAVQYWNSTSLAYLTACTPNSSQFITITVTSQTKSQSISFVVADPWARPVPPFGPATQLVFYGQPGNGVSNSPFAPQPVVAVEDANGQIVTSDLSPVTLTIAPGTGTSGATLSSTCLGSEFYGVVNFTNCSILKSGTGYKLIATNGSMGIANATSNAFNVVAAPASTLVITTLPVSGPASNVATVGPITIQEQDVYGNPSTNAETIALSSTSAGASFAATSGGTAITSVTIPAGSSSATVYYGDTVAGTPTITVAAPGLTSSSQTESITAAAPSKFAITSVAVSGPASTSATLGPVTIQEQDAYGNPTIAAENVTLASTSAGARFAGSSGGTGISTVAIPAGSSSTTFYYGDTLAGSPTVTASGALTSGTQAETISAAVPGKLVLTSTAVSGPASTSATLGSVTVQEQDIYGNLTTTAETVTLSSTSTGAKFAATSGGAGITTVVIPAGSSTASFFYGDTVAGTPTITVSAAGLTSGTQAETITAAAVSKLVITTLPVSGPASATSSVGPITVQEQDLYGNPTTTAETVSLASTSSGARFASTTGGTGITAVAIPGGSSAASFFYGDTVAGTPTITVSAAGLTSGTQAETITAIATKLVISSTSVSGPASASATLGPVTVQEQGAGGLPTTTAETVTLSSTSAGAKFAAASGGAGITTVAIPAGSSSATFYYGDTMAGTPTITVSTTGLTSGTQAETISALAPNKFVITTLPVSGIASTGANAGPITVQEQDSFGNPTTTAETVTLSSTSTGKIFAATPGGASITTIAIGAGTSAATFYYGDTVAGSPAITVSGALTSALQAETITAAGPTKFVITSTAVSGAASASATLGPITVQEDDTFGNPTTTAETVTLASTSAGAKFAATSGGTAITTIAIPGGSSSVSFYYGDTKSGVPLVTTSGSLTSATQSETISAGAPAKLVITSTAVSGPASASATLGPLTVQEQDAFGNVTTTAETVTLSSTSSGAKFAATSGGTGITTVAIPGGSSSTTFYYGDTKSGTPTISASDTGLTSGTQAETITPGTGVKLVITSGAFSANTNAAATSAFTTTLEDTFGNPTTSASAITVNLSSTSTTKKFAASSGGASATSVTLPANTQSVIAYYGDTKPGSPTLTAAATGLTSGTQVETITAVASQLIITSTAVSGTASASATLGPITVQEQDPYGNVSTTAVTVSLSSTSSGAKFAATSGGAGITTIAIPGGSSSATFYYGDTVAGTPTITTSSSGLTSSTQAETITAGAPGKLFITTGSFSATANASATSSFTVILEDIYGNPTTNTSDLTVNFSSTSPGGSFALSSGGSPITSLTAPPGSSSGTIFYGDTVAGSPTITMSATGLTSASQVETIVAGAPNQLTFTSAPVTGTASVSATLGPITIQEQDFYGNATTAAATVTLSSTSTGKIFAATSGGTSITTVAIVGGTSSANFFYGDTKSGTPTITATSPGLVLEAQTETIHSGTGVKLVITSSAFSTAHTSTPNATAAFTTTLEDTFGNPTTSASAITVNLSSTSSGAKFASSSNGSSVSSVSLLANTQSITAYYGDTRTGSPTITAAATGLTSGTQSETVT